MDVQNTKNNSKRINSPADFKKVFLLKFTKELIKHSSSGEISKLKNIISESIERERKELKEEKNKIKKIIEEKEKIPKEIKEDLNFVKKETPKKFIPNFQKPKISPSPRLLKIPETKLPSHLEYLRPTPTENIEIDLGKLNQIIKDPAVITLEVNPDEKVIVTGSMGRKPTSIILNKKEIDEIINNFSKSAKIPVGEGIFRVVVGKLVLSAIISEIVGSKFIIKKLSPIRQNIPSQPRIQNQKYQIMPPAPKIIRR